MSLNLQETITQPDLEKIRADFPILSRKVHNRPLVYFDNAATTQKPQVVIDALVNYYTSLNSNVHRGVHYLSQQATIAFEEVRKKLQQFVNARFSHEIVYTRGCTEAINLVASSWGRTNISAGDEILISTLEHHSNIVPWQMLCEEKGAVLRVSAAQRRFTRYGSVCRIARPEDKAGFHCPHLQYLRYHKSGEGDYPYGT